MTDRELPAGSLEWEEVKQLTDQDAEFIAEWAARALSKTDCFNYLVSGKMYEEDPEAHRLRVRAGLDRGSIEGYHLVNKTRTAFRTIFPPGHRDNRLDTKWHTSNDANWNRFVEKYGKDEGIQSRTATMLQDCESVLTELYGPDMGLDLYKSGGFAVHPDLQGKGVGTAMHKYLAEKTKQEGKIWFFCTMLYNAPFYEKVGCKLVGRPIAVGVDERGKQNYPAGNDFMRICQVDP